MTAATSLQAGQLVGQGRFVLVKSLGRGGMGVVWLAEDQRLREQVALKFLPPEITADAVALDNLRRETARSHRLTHTNIVRIHDFHEYPGEAAFIVMEFVDGPTLAAVRLQQAERVLSWTYLQPLLGQLCAALDYAHGENVIHRDLKPANIMVDARGRLKLADLGIAAVVSDSMSRVSVKNTTSGTLLYMSPQQLAGDRPQAADDIYSLGVAMYELLTGKPPFYTGDLTLQILSKAPEPLAERLAAEGVQNEIPERAAAVIMACLEKRQEMRPPGAKAVCVWIAGETEEVLAAQPPVVESQEIEPLPGGQGQPEAPLPQGRFAKLLWPAAFAATAVVCVLLAWLWHGQQARPKVPGIGVGQEAARSAASRKEAALELASAPAAPFTGDLLNTLWIGLDAGGESFALKFLAGGKLAYEAGRGVRPNGIWQQDGSNASMDINNGYARLSGTISAGSMSGSGKSRDGLVWSWKANPQRE